MTDQIRGREKSPASVQRLGIELAAIVAFLVLGYVAIKEIGGSTVIKLGTDGVSISVDEDENFVDILDRALDPEQTDPKTVRSMRAILLDKGFVDAASAADDVLSRALLNNYGFYVAHDPTLVDVLASYDYSQEPAIEIRDRLRRMLWDLKGPFGPGALSGAQAQFLRAIEELYDANGDQGPAPLAEAIWLRRIEWQTPFERRKFAAEIEVLPKSAAAEGILICKGSEHLAEKYVNISVSDPDDPTRRARGTGSIERVARVGEAFSCDNGVNVTEMLAGRILRMAITEDLARQILMPGEGFGPIPQKFNGQFLVRPRYLVSASQIPSTN